MKRFVCKIIFLFIFVSCILIVLNHLYINTNFWKGENYMNKFNDVPYKIELANFGSSHGVFNFKYDCVPEINTYNFGLLEQTYYYDYQLCKKYIDHFKKNAVVIILISYFGITQRPDYSKYRYRYYRVLPKSAMDYWSLNEEICYKHFPLFSAQNNILKIIHDIPEESMYPFYNRETYLDEEALCKFCIEEHKKWTAQEREMGQVGYEMNFSEVSSIIDLCLSHDLIPVLITTPVTDVLNEIYEKDIDFFPTFEQFTDDLCTKYPGIINLDYSRNEYFSKNHKLFIDGDHLNNLGAEEFTKTVISNLREKGLLHK